MYWLNLQHNLDKLCLTNNDENALYCPQCIDEGNISIKM